MENRQDETQSSWLPGFLRPSNQRYDSKKTDASTPPDERSSLLPKPDDTGEGETYEVEDESKSRTRRIATEFWVLFKASIPVILAYTLQNSLQTVSVLIVGRLSPEALSVAAFSYMFAMATAWLIGMGGTTAIDTLASASFTGSKNKHDLGIILQRALFILTLFYIPVMILWIFSEPVFKALKQEDYVARDSARFLSVLIPGGFGYIYFECVKKYLQAQGIMRPGTYVLLITSPINAGLNFLFIYTFKMGLLGAPIATGISYWLSFLLLVAYCRWVAGSECWGGFDRRCFKNIGTFARIAALGIVHVGTEWWAFEIVAIVAGQLGTISLASQSVIMTADQVMNTIPFGVGVATSARVGNLLGARDAKGAARAANTAAWLSMILGALVLAILMATKENFAYLFNDDIRVVHLTAEVLPYVALFQIADGLNGSCGGALRGQGRQHVGAAVNIISYYCGALPLGIYLAFHGWGLAGLWVGQCIALYLVGAAEWVIVAFSNWNKEVEKAFNRMDPSARAEQGAADEIGHEEP
ncbi:ethionine resistance protein [Friedmanniomyces endolithicus]|uniref:Ethionine resistance protein n=1 Tax=Friedmanniomyces endolithicus TaxID=329885 RepID=A0AAN6L3E3_9PEZI|nr:ethionine resistance protein [Friedmanniomyces endolithicus]KAK0296142.1 ethionine resistance protein [Friedmanniomyces endolithicus]KAK0834852.1 ethionine resistance protein [Friedmanniomyces endolithicus]KAK0923645.1 ethionine resistance protein [Friedmanniomyces endolithicus]KAK0977982.1 ethionine resistance protein [Friedmanniomyces endolithicus]